MPRPHTRRPAYRHYKPKNLAVVRIEGKDHYLGPYGSEASYESYHRLIAEWLARSTAENGPTSSGCESGPALTVNELIFEYWTFARTYYRKNDAPTSEVHCIKSALRPLRQLFGRTAVHQFGPKSLKLVREQMVAAGLCRTTINKYIHRIKRLFAWGVEQELLDVRFYQALTTVRGLTKGRTEAPEPQPVRPVTVDQIEATLPHLSVTLQAMVQFQRLTGCRPSEVCLIRPIDIDRTAPVWCYVPGSHKTEHHGKERRIFVGPKAQEILRPFLHGDPHGYCFSPRKHLAPRGGRSSRPAGDCYTTASYRRAIARACEVAFGMPRGLRVTPAKMPAGSRAELQSAAAAWRQKNCWAPNQLRHYRATEIRVKFGLEASQTVLGHSCADTTEIYAERDFALAENVMSQVG